MWSLNTVIYYQQYWTLFFFIRSDLQKHTLKFHSVWQHRTTETILVPLPFLFMTLQRFICPLNCPWIIWGLLPYSPLSILVQLKLYGTAAQSTFFHTWPVGIYTLGSEKWELLTPLFPNSDKAQAIVLVTHSLLKSCVSSFSWVEAKKRQKLQAGKALCSTPVLGRTAISLQHDRSRFHKLCSIHAAQTWTTLGLNFL